MTFPTPSFAHLRRLTDAGGLYEHARGATARREHGYCVDDVARALVVSAREPDPEARDLLEHYLAFTLAAQAEDGRFRNRRSADLTWTDTPSVDDCWGRALWGLGAVVASAVDAHLREAALSAFERGAAWRSPWSRAMAFAALGAAEVLCADPDHEGARALLIRTAGRIGRSRVLAGEWPWPEPRLTYANAAVPDALLACGHVLDDPALTDHALTLLGWLLDEQTRNGHLSVVPVGGRGPGDTGPGFDQQPIEVAALADACTRAYAVTGDSRWWRGVELAVAWFLGANDSGTVLYDADSGGGCDGLEREGRNENQGAESTLAAISTLQLGRLLLTPSLR